MLKQIATSQVGCSICRAHLSIETSKANQHGAGKRRRRTIV